MSQSSRSPVRHWSEFLAVRALLGLLRLFPRPLAMRFATSIVGLLDRFSPRLRRTARSNLQFAIPQIAAHETIIDEVFRSLARMLVVESRLPMLTRDNIHQWLRYEGLEHFHAAKQQGRGVIFFTAHLGHWELSAFAHGLLTEAMQVVARPLDNPLLDRYARYLRTLSGNTVIEKKDARPLLRALAQNQAIGILADQNAAPEEGVFVQFFGVQACAHTGVARLAAHTGAPVIPGFALWSEAEQRYILTFYPPVPITGDLQSDTQALHAQLEQVIRRHPGQWLWIHRRWKTRPPGEPPLYA